MRTFLFILFLGIFPSLIGCKSQYNDAYTQFIRPWSDAGDSSLGFGDVFHIDVYREEDLSSNYTVSERGTINFPLIHAVEVIGRTCGDLEDEISTRLGEGFLRTPSVSCTIVEVRSRRLSVVGRVGSPGTLSYSSGMTVVEAVAQAGGFSEAAARDRVVVTRTIDGQIHEIHVPVDTIMNGQAPNFPLWPNDTVFVPEYTLFH